MPGGNAIYTIESSFFSSLGTLSLTTSLVLPEKADMTIPPLKKPPHKLYVPYDLAAGVSNYKSANKYSCYLRIFTAC